MKKMKKSIKTLNHLMLYNHCHPYRTLGMPYRPKPVFFGSKFPKYQ